MNIDKYTLEELKGQLKDNPKLPPEARTIIEKAIEMKSKSAPKKATTTKKTTTAKPKATAKKTTTRKKTTTTTRKKTTPEQKAQNKVKVQNATGKTIEECEKILAEYKANRMAQKEQNKDRLENLEKKGHLIEGTDEKTLEATTETVNKEVKPKIEKEVKAIVETAEKEAKKEVSEKGKTKEQVEKEVKKKAEKIITKKVDDMTKDLAKVSANYIKNIRDEIASIGDKKKAQEFLIELRGEIDVLLKAYGYGGAVQSYNVPWMGGNRPMPMFEKGGNIEGFKKIMDSTNDYHKDRIRQQLKSELLSSGEKDEIREMKEKQLEYLEKNYSKGGKFADGGMVEDFIISKGYHSPQEVYFEADGEFIEVIQADKDERNVGVFYYTDEIESISRKMLDKISSAFDNRLNITLFTNAGVDLHSKENGKFKNITVKRMPFMYAKGGKFADGGMVEFETKQIKGYSDELKDYTHFAIHKPTNSIAGNWDYKEYDRDELMGNKEDYFFIDLKDDHEGNVDKFKKSDFAIITRSGLKNKGIDLNNYNVFYGQKYAKGGKFADGGMVSKGDDALKQAEELFNDSMSLERRLREERRLAVETDKDRGNSIGVLKRRIRMNKDLANRMSSWAFSVNDGMNKEKYSKYLNYLKQINPTIKSYSKGGKFADGGEVGDYKLEKIVMHYDGRDWMLDEYPSFIDNGDSDDWLGMSEISLERAKELAFELGGDEAIEEMEEINEAETIEELQDAISDLKNYQRDNTYNQSWWGGVIDFGVLTEDGEGYGTGLLILRMHRGGDPRGNYYDYAVYELDSFIEEFPPYYSRLTYQVTDKDGNYASFETEDMEGYTLRVIEDNITDLEEDDYIKIDELEEKFGVDVYAKGGKVKKTTKLGWKRDRERLSKEPHEQAYKPKRKGSYSSFAKGGSVDEETYVVDVVWRQLNKKGLGKFNLKESDIERLEDNYGSTYYFELYDSTNKKPISYIKMKNILDKSMKEMGLMHTSYAKGGSVDEVRIYVADLEAYNNGQLKGGWLDLTDYSDGSEVMEAIDELIDGEEYAIHDYEGFPSNMYSEYMGEEDFNQIIEVLEAQDEIGIPMDVILEFMSDRGIDDISTVQDAYYGEYDDAEDFAYRLVEEGVMKPNPYDVYVTDTDKRIIAGEESDFRVDEAEDDDLISNYGDRDAYDEAEEEEDFDKMEELVDEAREEMRNEIYDEWYNGLDSDPIDFLVNEQGIYSEEDALGLNFINIDYEKVASELEYDHTFIEGNDGQVYVFSNNYAKGGKLKKKPYNRSYHMDRKRLSKEKHEQAYLPKRKKSYFAKGGKLSKDDAIIKALKMGVDFDKDFHAQSYGNELSQLAKEVGYRKSKSSSGSLGRAFFEHLEKIYDKNSSYYKSMV